MEAEESEVEVMRRVEGASEGGIERGEAVEQEKRQRTNSRNEKASAVDNQVRRRDSLFRRRLP